MIYRVLLDRLTPSHHEEVATQTYYTGDFDWAFARASHLIRTYSKYFPGSTWRVRIQRGAAGEPDNVTEWTTVMVIDQLVVEGGL